MFCVSGHFPPVLGPELPEWTDVRDAPMLFSRIRPRLDRTLPARPRMPKSIAVSLRPPLYDDDDTEGRPRPGVSAIDAPTAPLRHENRLHLAYSPTYRDVVPRERSPSPCSVSLMNAVLSRISCPRFTLDLSSASLMLPSEASS